MSITSDDQYDEYDDQPEDSSVIKRLRQENREKANELKALREQSEQFVSVQKENALFKANLGSLNEAQQAAVIATSKEITAEALRSQAELLGFVAPPEPVVPVGDIEAIDRITGATAGGVNVDAASYEADIGAARNEAEVLAVMAEYGKQPATYD